MARSTIRDHLAQARQYVEQGREHIARQRAVIARLEGQGHDATQARNTLALFEAMQARHVADCEKLEKAWEGNAEPFSHEDVELRIESAHEVGRASVEELRWYQVQIAQTADVLRRSKEALDASQEILAKLHGNDARGQQAD